MVEKDKNFNDTLCCCSFFSEICFSFETTTLTFDENSFWQDSVKTKQRRKKCFIL